MRRTPRFSVFASLALVFLVVPLARAEISHIAVSVDGLACPFCVYGIEKKLKEIEGVRNVETNLKAGLATLVLADGAAPNFGKVETAAKKAGFTLRAITLTAIGSAVVGCGGSMPWRKAGFWPYKPDFLYDKVSLFAWYCFFKQFSPL